MRSPSVCRIWCGSATNAVVLIAVLCGCQNPSPSLWFTRPQTSKLEHVSTANFDQRVLQADMPVLVDFYAEWCGPCQRLGPVLENFAEEQPGLRVVKVNVDEDPDLARRYEVKSMPSLIVFRGGQVVSRQAGAVDKTQLKSMMGVGS